MDKITSRHSHGGFTLIELVLVIAIISLLSIVALVAIKPGQRLADARDARRAQDINQLLSGVHQCVLDKKDSITMDTCLGGPTVGDTYEIVTTSGITSGCQAKCTTATSDSSCLRLDATLTDYFLSLPSDPGGVVSGHTGYSISLRSNGMTVLEACAAENGTIKVSR